MASKIIEADSFKLYIDGVEIKPPYEVDMANYKKRGQAGWTGRKEAKSKKYVERNFGKQEIKQALTEFEEGEEFRYPHKKPVKKNEKVRLENHIAWYERMLVSGRDWFLGDGWLKSGLEKAKKRYKEKFGNNDE